MSRRNDNQRDQGIEELVTTYENSLRNGQQPYLSEEQFDDLLSYYYGVEDFEEALAVCDLALQQFRFTPDFYKWKAVIHKILAQESDALGALEQLNIYAPHDYEVKLLRLEVLVHFEHGDDSRELLDQLLSECEEDFQLSILAYYDAVLLARNGQIADAFQALCSSIRLDHWQEVAYEELCHEPAYVTFYPKLVGILDQITAADAFNDMVWYYLGIIYDSMGDDTAALEAFDYARSLDDKHPDYLIDYADKLFELEHYQRALEFYHRYLKLPESFESYDTCLRIGSCYQQLEQIEPAIQVFLRAAELNPRSYESYQHLGECLAFQEKWGKAAQYYDLAVSKKNHPAICWLGLACCRAAISEFQAAEEAFIKATEHTSEFSDAYVTYAIFLIEQGREQDALRIIEEARQEYLDPTLAYGAVAIYCLCNRKKHALFLLTEAIDAYPDSTEILFYWNPELEDDREIQAVLGSWS
ncbi:MAG: tetratricopeptide repeat protein [Bacteroidota bacterium]